jgi:hypothetical protein
VRLLASTAILYHITAVFIGAWNATPSPFVEVASAPFRDYVLLMDLNHGYRFFAPNPSPSHLFRYRLTFDDGSTRDGFFPDRKEHWPRLLYHRHFMLSEQLGALGPEVVEPNTTAAAPPALAPAAGGGYRALAESYAAHLLRISGAATIDWELVRHAIPSPAEVLGGRSLTDGDLYRTLERGTLARKELP